MEKLIWDAVGTRNYETGISNVALYVFDSKTEKYGAGVAWSGVTAITESPSGAEASPLYADNIKYLNLYSAEDLGLTLEAYSSPVEFDECDGTATLATGVSIGQQERATFALAYKTLLGNDTNGTDRGYKLHIVYGCKASPSERAYSSVNDSPEAMTLSWELTTTPIPVEGFKATARVIIDSTTADEAKLKTLEDQLFGCDSSEATLLLPDEIKAHFGTEG